MALSLSQVSESVTRLVAGAAPLLTAIRIGPNRHISGFLWRGGLVITADQVLPAAASWSLVTAGGSLAAGRPGPRDQANNLAAIWLDQPTPVPLPAVAPGGAAGALVLALGAAFDGTPTVRLTTIHGFPRASAAGGAMPVITLDLPDERASPGGIVLDAEGRFLGVVAVAPSGGAMLVPAPVVARFADAALGIVAASGAAASDPAGDAVWTAPFRYAEAPAATAPVADAATWPATPSGTMTGTVSSTPSGGMTNGAPYEDSWPESAHLPALAPLPGQASPTARGLAAGGWIGLSLQPITIPQNLVHRAGQTTARQVVSVTKGGPADRAGLRAGDVVLTVNRSPTSGNYALRAFLGAEHVGSILELRVMRDGLLHAASLMVEPRPGS